MFFVIFLQRYTFFRNLSRKKVLQFGYKLIFRNIFGRKKKFLNQNLQLLQSIATLFENVEKFVG